MLTQEMLHEHHDNIMSPGLPDEAMAEGLFALELVNTPGSVEAGTKWLAEWYKKWMPSKAA